MPGGCQAATRRPSRRPTAASKPKTSSPHGQRFPGRQRSSTAATARSSPPRGPPRRPPLIRPRNWSQSPAPATWSSGTPQTQPSAHCARRSHASPGEKDRPIIMEGRSGDSPRSSSSARSRSLRISPGLQDVKGRLHPSRDVPARPPAVLARSNRVLTLRRILAA